MGIKMGGIVSGMDTESIIKESMKLERQRVDKVEADKQYAVWTREKYQELNTKFANFIIDTKKELGIQDQTTFGGIVNKNLDSLDWVKSITNSNEDAIGARARKDANEGSYQVKVNSLANNWSCASKSAMGSNDDLSSLATQFNNLDKNDTIKFKITTQSGEITIDKSAGDTTLKEIVSEINNSDIGVKAIYDEDADRFFLQTENTGSESTLKIEDMSLKADGITGLNFIAGDDADGSSLLSLQYYNSDTSEYKEVLENVEHCGVDASINFGAATDIKYSTNEFTLNGIEFDLKETTASSFTVKVGTDIQGVYDKISEFVEKYNEIVDEMNKVVSEKRYRDYKPLTSDEKKAMESEDIKLWEAKSKQGLLRADELVTGISARLRGGLYQEVSGETGTFSNLFDLGITTERYSSGDLGGRLTINETKLKEAIQNDADSVIEVLFKKTSTTKSEDAMTKEELDDKRANSGIFTRAYDNLISGMKSIISKSGVGDHANEFKKVDVTIMLEFATSQSGISLIDHKINDYDKKIKTLNDYLSDKEDSYWKKYSSLETALSKFQSQGDWLSAQLGG